MPGTPPALSFKCLAIALCLTLGVGCATAPIPTGARAVVSAFQAPFYKYGPAQTFGPDFLLSQGVTVTVLKRDWAYSRVMTDDGTAGYMSSDDLKPAPPPTPVPKGSSSGVRIPTSGKPKPSNVTPTRGSPLFEGGDLAPLPEPGQDPKPAPGFRF